MNNMLQYIINLVVFVPIIIVMIIVSIKFSKSNLGNLGIYKYTQILERTNLKKDTDVFILKIGDEGCVLVSSPSNIEKIKELSKEEIDKIEAKRNEARLASFDKNRLKLKKLNLKERKNGKLR